MESSILNKLPWEVRSKIYAEVFDGARITIVVGYPRIDDGEVEPSYIFDRQCALAATCRHIKDECSFILWRIAVCRVDHEVGAFCWLHHLRKILPWQYAQHIAHLRGVAIPTIDEVCEWSLEPISRSLLGFPRLQTFGFDMRNAGDFGDFLPAVPISGVPRNLRKVKNHHTGLDRQLLPFTDKGLYNFEPRQLLKQHFGIEEDCAVQMVTQIQLETFPVRCSISASGRGICSHLPCVRKSFRMMKCSEY